MNAEFRQAFEVETPPKTTTVPSLIQRGRMMLEVSAGMRIQSAIQLECLGVSDKILEAIGQLAQNRPLSEQDFRKILVDELDSSQNQERDAA